MTMPINPNPQTLPPGPTEMGGVNGMDDENRQAMLKQYLAAQQLAAYQEQQVPRQSLLGFLFKWTLLLGGTIGGGVLLWKNRSGIADAGSNIMKIINRFRAQIANPQELKNHVINLEKLTNRETIKFAHLKGCEVMVGPKSAQAKEDVLIDALRAAVATRYTKHATPIIRIFQNSDKNQAEISQALKEMIELIASGQIPNLKDKNILNNIDKIQLSYTLFKKGEGSIQTEVIVNEILEQNKKTKGFFA